jgi:hypothetical protein
LVAREVCLALDVFDEGLVTSQKSLDKAGYTYHCAATLVVMILKEIVNKAVTHHRIFL